MQNIKTVNPNKLVKEQYMHRKEQYMQSILEINHLIIYAQLIKSFFKKTSLKDRFENIKATSAPNIKGEFI